MSTKPDRNIERKANEILETIMAYARLDFESQNLLIDDDGDVFDAISSGINMLGEELKENVISLKEKENLLREIHHRVKNNMQIISSLLSLQFSNENDERVVKLIEQSQNRIYAMALVHEMLYNTSSFKMIDLHSYISFLTKSLFDSYTTKEQNINLVLRVAENTMLEIEKIIPLGLIINEIITNSLKYAFDGKQGEIAIDAQDGDLFIVNINDNGRGLSETFNMEKDRNLGMQLIFLLAEQIDAQVEMVRSERFGYKISFQK